MQKEYKINSHNNWCLVFVLHVSFLNRKYDYVPFKDNKISC